MRNVGMGVFEVCEIDGIKCFYSGASPLDEIFIMRKGPDVKPGLVYMPYIPVLVSEEEREKDAHPLPSIDPPPRKLNLKDAVAIIGPYSTGDMYRALIDTIKKLHHESEGTL